MADLRIRNLDNQVRERLRRRSADHGRSMEFEVRSILEEAVREPDRTGGFLGALRDRFRDVGGVELDISSRSTPVRAADMSS